MAVTRSRAVERAELRSLPYQRPAWRISELLWTAGAAVLVMIGLWFAFAAKGPDLAAPNLVNLNTLNAREDLLPAVGAAGDAHGPA